MRTDRDLVAHARLTHLLRYDCATGIFTWAVRRKSSNGKVKPGVEAGTPHTNGYLSIRIDGRAYLAHRLAWFYVHGRWPEHQIDHVDGDRRNNRISNLRDVPSMANTQNQRRAHPRSRTGLLGVIAVGERFRAQIGINGRSTYIGVYATAEEAHAAYLEKKRSLHEGCTI